MPDEKSIRSGYVAFTGPANSGRSAVVNALMGLDISPSHSHSGVTRSPISCIHSTEDQQICLMDTPPLEYYDVSELIGNADLVCLTVNSTELSSQLRSSAIRGFLRRIRHLPVIVLPTFIDHFPSKLHGALVNQVSISFDIVNIVPMCAPCGQGIKRLKKAIAEFIPQRGRLFPENCVSPHSERFMVSEQIRYSLFCVLPPEIASTTAVQIEEFSIRDRKRYVRANLYVARHANKGVVIGKRGSMLQNIAGRAAESASRLIERPLNLDLWVKVRESWPDNADDLGEFGYIC